MHLPVKKRLHGEGDVCITGWGTRGQGVRVRRHSSEAWQPLTQNHPKPITQKHNENKKEHRKHQETTIKTWTPNPFIVDRCECRTSSINFTHTSGVRLSRSGVGTSFRDLLRVWPSQSWAPSTEKKKSTISTLRKLSVYTTGFLTQWSCNVLNDLEILVIPIPDTHRCPGRTLKRNFQILLSLVEFAAQ